MAAEQDAAEGNRRLGRDELDRVIRRAVELQFQHGDTAEGQALAEDEVLRIGREVGIEERHVRRALGELHAEALVPDLPEERGMLGGLMGPGAVQASRVVPGSPEEVEETLAEHFRVGESLTRIRSRRGRSRWEPAEGVLASLQRSLRWKGFRYDLARARSVELTLASLEDGFTLVAISADLRGVRTGNAAGYGALGGTFGGGAGLGIGLVVAGGTALALPGLLLGAAGGVWLGRGEYRKEADRVRLAMEGILDRLEAGEPLARRSRGILLSPRKPPSLPEQGGGP